MAIDVGSPTELAEGDSEEETENKKHNKVKLEKRKRVANDNPARARPVPEHDDEDEDLDSPSKRASVGDEKPLTASELRVLLSGHVAEMKTAWGEFHGRLGAVESEQARVKSTVGDLQARTVVVEKDAAQQRQIAQDAANSLENLATEVKNMKVRIDRVENSGRNNGTKPAEAGQPDPWADFLQKRAALPANDGVNLPANSKSATSKDDQLSEEEKRTLVVGGWLQDTRRGVIEEESAVILALPEIKDLIDGDKLAVYGPRRSVGMLKFSRRGDETEGDMRNRMWEVIKALSKIKYILPSTRQAGEDRPMWASFVKTRTARLKSSHVSLIRRVVIALAKDAGANGAAGVNAIVNDQQSAFDCDWNLGTIWSGPLKLGSASHRPPRGEECITLSGGWVSITAVAQIDSVGGDLSRPCAIRRWGKFGQWNLAGQKVDLLDVAVPDLDIVAVQEIARGEPGWGEVCTEEFQWTTHRAAGQWRGVGVGIALDKLDSVLHKVATSRGVWVVARLVDMGRVIIGSLHGHTGVTNDVYQAAVHEFIKACPSRYRHLPLLCGVDANEVPSWNLVDEPLQLGHTGSNLTTLVHDSLQHGVVAAAPEVVFANAPTHYPRDEERSGRQIDMIFSRQIRLQPVSFHAERRHTIGTDHALLITDILVTRKRSRNTWGNDSRARWMSEPLPDDVEIIEEDDIVHIAKTCTRPRTSCAYKDSAEVR
ncbi:unnamed protein product, partial [Symbiodinium necroappetens]